MFSMEMFFRVNLGPLHLLDKSYLRKESIISQIVSKDLNKSLAVASFSTTSFKNEPSVSRIVLVTAICY